MPIPLSIDPPFELLLRGPVPHIPVFTQRRQPNIALDVGWRVFRSSRFHSSGTQPDRPFAGRTAGPITGDDMIIEERAYTCHPEKVKAFLVPTSFSPLT
jgi:hypothetical protein